MARKFHNTTQILPNKILITTRHLEFTTNKQIEVEGMNKDEFDRLVSTSAESFDIVELVTPPIIAQLYRIHRDILT